MRDVDVYTDGSTGRKHGGIGVAIYGALTPHRALLDLERIEIVFARVERPSSLALGPLLAEVFETCPPASAMCLELRAAALGIRHARSLGATSVRLFSDCEAVEGFASVNFGANTSKEAESLAEAAAHYGAAIVILKIDRRWNGSANRLARIASGRHQKAR